MICREQVYLSVRAPSRRTVTTGAGHTIPDREGVFHDPSCRSSPAG